VTFTPAQVLALDTFDRSDVTSPLGTTPAGEYTLTAQGTSTWGIKSNQAY
jgi:hypothetical protein